MRLHLHSHPRSGTHYLSDLLEANFGPVDWGIKGHFFPEDLEDEFETENGYHLYIWRNFYDVACSLAARAHTEISVSEFSDTPWGDLYSILHDGGNNNRWPGWVPQRHKNMTPYEWWKLHVETWLDFATTRTDVYVVTYEDLNSRFQHTMSGVANWLGVERDSFKNIEKKADKSPVRKGGFQGV